MSKQELLGEIVRRLKTLAPEKIILFGSYAWGNPENDSDIDIYVVTNDDIMPTNWKAQSEIYLKYMKQLSDLQKDIDLIVHTKPMHNKFVALDGMFCRKILRDGVTIYETTH